MTAIVQRTTSVSLGLISELTVAGETVNLILEKIEDRNVTVYQGGMIAGQRLYVVALLEELIPELDAPDSIQNLAITKMAVELRPDKGAFSFEAAIGSVTRGGAWSITLDSGPTLSIQQLALSVSSVKSSGSTNGNQQNTAESLSQQRKLSFEGLFELFGGEFGVKVAHQFSSQNGNIASQWGFSATAQNISITEVIKAFGFSQDKLDEYGLRNLVVSLAFALQQTRYQENSTQIVESRYTFTGSMDWDTGIALVPGEETLQIQAAIQITKTSSNRSGGTSTTLKGAIAGTVKASIPFFDTLQLSVIYTFSRTSSTSSSGRSSQALANRTGELIFQLQISTLLLSAVYTNINNRKLLRFSVSLVSGKNPTIGDLIAYIVSVYDSSIIDFELDPPWDEFAKQEIALDKFSLEIDLTNKSITISYKATLNVLIAKVSNVGLSYQFGTKSSQVSAQQNNARTASNKKIAIALDLSIPGQPKKRVQWDPVNENPPEVPSTKAPIFELKFLALGQRVAFAPEIVQQARTIEQFTTVMRQTLVPLPPIKRRQNPLTALQQSLPSAVSSDPTQPIQFSGQPIQFSAESGWLIGAQFVILGSIEISIIFNDPFIYGLRISLSGPPVQSFAGFEFEILYRRISDTVGVYRSELVLPDTMRYIDFGAVHITLPVVALEIYTNGDFGIDVGFPWGGDFSRSIAVNVTIFLGLGGFYFNKLSAETATSVPDIVSGTFDPVLEFGIGLQVGLGKIIKKGPLRAEFSITMHGILQGVFATYNPTDTNEKKATYYRIQGGVAIVGRIYGVVDFKVIQVDIEVLVKVAVLFVVEVYKAIQVALVATVSVKASIKIAFVRIRFKFKLTVREQFVLGSDSTPPWQLAAGSGGAMAATVPVFTARAQTLHPSQMQKNARANRSFAYAKAQGTSSTGRVTNVTTTNDTTQTSGTTTNVTTQTSGGRSLRWDNGTTGIQLALPGDVRTETVKDGKLRLDIYFQPSFTKTETEVSGIGLLFMENSIPLDDNSTNDNDTDFDELVKALFKWVIYAYLSDSERNDLNINTSAVNVDAQVLTLELLEDVYTLFVNYLEEEAADEFWEPLIRFLSRNFIFDITDRPIDNTEISGTIFPMFPQLEMELKDGADTVLNTVDFDRTKYSPDQIKAIQTYFQSLNYNHNQSTEEVLGQLPTNNAFAGLAIAELLFIDYFTLIIRSAVQLGIDHVRDKKDGVDENGTITLGTLLNNFNGGESFQSLAGMTSRFLLHGLRIPTFTGSTTTVNGQQAAYIATGQQFTVTVTRTAPATDGDSETVTITPNEIRLFKPDMLTWIRLIDDPSENSDSETLTPELNYPFPDTAPYNTIETIKQFDAAATSGILPTTSPNIPTVVGLYNPTNQQYTIRQKTYWNESINAATSNNLLWELPSGLCDYLKSKSDQTSLTLLYNQQPVQDGETLNTAEIDPGYTWATKLTLEIRQVSTSDGSGFLPTVYAIERIETASRQLLQNILTANVTPTTLTLLYLDDSGDSKVLTRNASAEVLMLKTNLSLDSGDNRTVTLETGNNATFLPFLRLVQESTVVNSEGYYLNYSYTENDEEKGLPDSLFADGDTAQVTLLMTFSSTAASYNNCLNIPSDHSQSSTLNGVSEIFATSSQTTNVLRIPAGNLGFRLTRTAIEPQDNDTATDEIQNLYQLLSYQVPSTIAADFETGQDRLPIGPIEEDEDNTTWVYEKVLPVYALTTAANTPSQALPEILKDTLNPYYGIGDTFTLDFRWQDIYGNRLGSDGNFAEGISQKLGYFDPILGINQWPSVGESYQITSKDDKTANLILELVLDQSKYIPTPGNLFTEVLDQIKTDRATYQKIYYQVHDSNLRFTVSTSVIPSGDQELTDAQRAAFTGFVDNVYKYLVTLEYLQQFSYTVSGNSESLESVANQYGCDIGDLGDSNGAVSSIFTSGQSIQIPVGIRVEPTNSLVAIATKLNKDYGIQSDKVEEIVTKYAKTADLLAVGGIISYTDTANHFVSYTVQDGDTFESIAIAQLALEEDHLIEIILQTIAQGLDTTQTLTNGVLIKGLEAPHVNNYVTLNATLEEIAYGVLQLENADLDLEFDQILTDRINEIIAENESTVLLAGVTVSALDSTTQDGETLGNLRDRLLAASQDVVEAIRDLEIFPTDTTLTVTVTKNDEATPTPFNVEIKIITDKTWSAIATAFPNTSRIETVETVILANAQRQDLLVAGSTITITMPDSSLDYTIQAQDSLYHIALNQFIATTDVRSIDVLKSSMVAEVGALDYTIAEAILPEQNTIAYLTQQLHLQTNLHRTVLETVQAVGNISDILTESAIASQLAVVAAGVSDMTGLFGTEDVILADVLFNYTVTSGDSFDQMIAIAAAHDSQIITDQTTAGDIALQTPSLALESGATLYIPDRFTLDTSSAQNADSLAVVQSTAQTTSLSTLTSTMGTEITPAAVAIANQTLAGLLSGNTAIDVRPVLASLTKISYNSDDTVNSDLERLALFIDSQTIETGTDETLYTLTSRWAQTLVNFKNSIDAEASQAQQSIGAVNAIYEQLDNLAGANRIALRALLDPNDSESSLSILKATLLDAQGNLKSQFEPSTVHSQPETLDVPDAIANIETAHGQPDDQVLIDTLQTSLDIIHRMYDLSCLKTAVDLLEKRSQRPLTVAEVGQALQNESGLIEPNQNWIVPPAVASTTVDLTIRDNNNSLLYPTDLLFSVTVQLEMRRNKDLMDPGYVPEAEVVSAYFAPKTVVLTSSSDDQNAEFSERLASLDPFAKAFEQALPNLKLAVGRNAGNIDNANPQNSDTLWAVHLGDTGISYDIKEDFPYFFSAAPLSNTLISGEVNLYSYTQQNGLDQTSTETVRVDAVDLNGLARKYLRAIEDILKPETAIPAVNDTTLKGELGRILNVKASLADSISKNVTHVLDTSLDTNSSEYTTRQSLAVAALQKELLTNLADAYDIETIVQYNVDVAIADGYQWSGQDIPRLSGQPVMSGAYYTNPESTPNSTSSDAEKQALLQSIDFTLSPAKISLSDANNGKSTLTFFFNTQTPQRYEDIAVNLNYQVNELEYNINTTNSTSSWLNFIQPLNDEPNQIGDVQIPIPLRDFPLPPSLISHTAIPDPDSFAGEILSAEDIRDWNYVFLYEHPDVAQDTIECRIEYNGSSKLTINDVSLEEGQTAVFTITLSPPSEQTVTVNYQTQDGTAKAPGDYTATSGNLQFDPGETSKEIRVEVKNDNVVENNETFTLVLSNAVNADIADPVGVGTIIDTTNTIDPLLDTLVRFNNLYPTLASDLKALETGLTDDNQTTVTSALSAFATLAEDVARSWQIWQPIAIAQASRQTVHYNIDENLSADQETKTVIITPTNNLPVADQQVLDIELPGYELNDTRQNDVTTNSPTVPYTTIEYDFTKLLDATGVETFGESALPDRKVTVTNLDVLDYQNAWGAIRLARNKNLIDGRETNAAFIFQTPEVRFKNRITPLIVNDKRWDIADLGDSRSKTLTQHLEELFKVLLPAIINRPYDIRISCQYAFALASNTNDEELLASLPVLLTPRFTVQKSGNSTMLQVTQQLRTNIVREIENWQTQKNPNQTRGRYLFSFSLFSNPENVSSTENPNLPLLTVENLNLLLTDIIEG